MTLTAITEQDGMVLNLGTMEKPVRAFHDNSGSATLVQTPDSSGVLVDRLAIADVTGKVTISVPVPTSALDAIAIALVGGAAAQGTVRAFHASVTTYGTAMTSGNVVGARGAVTLGANVGSGCYIYGAQGKVIANSKTIAAGSGMVYAVMGQLDLTGVTVTNGYVAGIGSDIFGVNSGTVNADLFYGQHAGGGTIQSFFNCYGRATYAFVLNSNTGGTAIVATGGTYSTADGYLLCLVDGAVRRIPFFAGTD